MSLIQALSLGEASSRAEGAVPAAATTGTLSSRKAIELTDILNHRDIFDRNENIVSSPLADALLSFSLDIVAIVAEYAKDREAQDKTNETIRESLKSSHALSALNTESWGRHVTSIDLLNIQKVAGTKAYSYVTINLPMLNFILSRFPNVQRLKIPIEDNAFRRLCEFSPLRHLDFGKNFQKSMFQICADKISHLESLAFPLDGYDAFRKEIVKKLPLFKVLKKLIITGLANDLVLFPALESLKELKTLWLQFNESEHPTKFSYADISQILGLSLEVICIDNCQWFAPQCLQFNAAKTLKVVIVKDCKQISEADCASLHKAKNITVAYITTNPDKRDREKNPYIYKIFQAEEI